MSTTYPTTKQSIPNPVSTDLLDNADATLDHDYQHSTINDTIEALQDKVGIDGSATTSTHDYKLSAVTGSAKALTSGNSTQSVTDLTLVTPVLSLGSDATGDMYYRNSSGELARLPAGTDGQIISYSSGIPTTIANPAAADASTTVKGVVEIATTAEITAGTATGGTGAVLVVPASAVGSVGASKLVQFTAATKYPAADGSLITNIASSSTSGISAGPASSSTQTITHSLGKTPAIIRLNAQGPQAAARSIGVFDASGNRCLYSTSAGATIQAPLTSTTFSISLYDDQATDGIATGVVGNLTATTFDIVWTVTQGVVTTNSFLWEAQ